MHRGGKDDGAHYAYYRPFRTASFQAAVAIAVAIAVAVAIVATS